MTKEEIYEQLVDARDTLCQLADKMNAITRMVEQLPDTAPQPEPGPSVERNIQPVDEFQPAYPIFAEDADFDLVYLHKLTGPENHDMQVIFCEVENNDGTPANNVILHLAADGSDWPGGDGISGNKGDGKEELSIVTAGKFNVSIIGVFVNGTVVPVKSDILWNCDNSIWGRSDDEGTAPKHHSWTAKWRARE